METIHKLILLSVPTTLCNLKCGYCYLSQREDSFQGCQANFLYSPEHVGKAFSQDRLGGPCFFNICADGETLLTKGLDAYIFEIVNQGHYVEIVTNMTVTPVLDTILSWDEVLRKRITFKCSFHYLELKKRDLLERFTDNVKKVWESGCSACVEITPDDALIPYIDEVIAYSKEHFGALPHLSIARDDNNRHEYLTDLSLDEYRKTWEVFESSFWTFKRTIFNVRRNEYCYAGAWSLYVDLATGQAIQCYCSRISQNVFENPDKPIRFLAIGACRDTHCYNGHALLTLGCIPKFTDLGYGMIRDRIRADGTHWIADEIRAFMNTKLEAANPVYQKHEKRKNERKLLYYRVLGKVKRLFRK